MKKKITVLLLSALLLVSFTACSIAENNENTENENTESETTIEVSSDMFTDRDMEIGYDEENSTHITLSDSSALADSASVTVSDSTVTITDEGTYILSGTLNNGMIIVDAEDTDKIQLVLSGAQITNSTSAAIYVRSADKVFITTASGTENTLTNDGEYIAIDDNNIDAVVFSKSDLTLNGAGNLTITATVGHGIVSKDDLMLTCGNYIITSASHAISGKDSVRIANGSYTIDSGKDGINAENTDDTSLGFIYIAGGQFVMETADDSIHSSGDILIKDGEFELKSGDDAIHSDAAVTIQNGTYSIPYCYEGIEGLSVTIDNGTFDITASDDGINAAGGNDSSGFGGGKPGSEQFSSSGECFVTINGGNFVIVSDGDCIDSNNALTISGGTLILTCNGNGNTALDCDGTYSNTGGDVTTNDGSENNPGQMGGNGTGRMNGGSAPDGMGQNHGRP
ncbi:MAG: carbohydrate-binding domain-containing protein [Candidatus Gastranaerophilaceae bacterium]